MNPALKFYRRHRPKLYLTLALIPAYMAGLDAGRPGALNLHPLDLVQVGVLLVLAWLPREP